MIWPSDVLRVSNERKNCFVLLDNNAEKSKKQINPNTISLKQQNSWCENYPFFLDNGRIWNKV